MTETSTTDITDFLTNNPNYFVENPEILKSIKIPHECGTAISQLEYQLKYLRDENQHLNLKMVDLIQVARENDLLSERMHRLTVDVMQCSNIEELVPTVQDLLRDKFGVDIVHFRLFPTSASSSEQLGFRAPDHEGWALFRDILDGNRINLGALTEDENNFLFDADKDQVNSSAVLPLKREKVIGLLGLGSFANDRFSRQMGTVYLQQMAAVIGQALANFGIVEPDQVSNG